MTSSAESDAARIRDILGLEVDPDGCPDFLLTRNEAGKVIEGVNFSEEVTALVALVADAVADLRSRIACIAEICVWDRPYDTRLDAIRGMCDLSTNGMTPAPTRATSGRTLRGVSVGTDGCHALCDYPVGRHSPRCVTPPVEGRTS